MHGHKLQGPGQFKIYSMCAMSAEQIHSIFLIIEK